MSGYKSSDIRYNQIGLARVMNRNLLHRIVQEMESLQKKLINSISKINGLKNELKNNLNLDEIEKEKQNLEATFKEIKKKQEEFENNSEKLSKLSLQDIENLNRVGEKLISEILSFKRNVERLEANLEKIKNIDKQLTELKSIKSKIEAELEQNKSLIFEWNRNEHDKLLQEKTEFENRLAKLEYTFSIEEIKELLSNGRTYLAKLNGLVVSSLEKDTRAKSLIKQLEELINELNKNIKQVNTEIISDKFYKYLNLLEIQIQSIRNRNLDDIEAFIKRIRQVIPEFVKIDKELLEAENTINTIIKLLREQDANLQKWYPEQYGDIKNKVEVLVNQLKNLEEKILNIDLVVLEEAIELNISSKELSKELSQLINDVQEKEEQHQKRLYVIKALREVCASLGFEELEPPHYAEENNIHSPVVQKFDTKNSGVIKFIITLDGKLESDSGISTDRCGLEFTDVSRLLREEFGMETEFRRVDDEEPLRIQKNIKELPNYSNERYKQK